MDKTESTSTQKTATKRDFDEHLLSGVSDGRFPNTTLDADDNEAALQLTEGPPKKRKKKHHQIPNKWRRKRGALSVFRLLNLSLEVFSEIMFYLNTRDLLHLARSSKTLRMVLMSRTTQAIWSTSRKNVPTVEGDIKYPDCPSDLSEPAYASLTFDTECLQCGAKKAGIIDLRLRLRTCEACFKARSGLGDALGYISSFRSLLEDQSARLHGAKSSDVVVESSPPPSDAELTKIRSLVLHSHLYLGPGRPTNFHIFGPNALQIYNHCMTRKAQMNQNEYEQYLDLRGRDMAGVRQHAQSVNKWKGRYDSAQEVARFAHVRALDEGRRLEVTKRLMELGYHPQDFPQIPHSFKGVADRDNKVKYCLWRRLALQSGRLLEDGLKGWNNIRPQLEAMLSSTRALRLEMDRSPVSHLLLIGPWRLGAMPAIDLIPWFPKDHLSVKCNLRRTAYQCYLAGCD